MKAAEVATRGKFSLASYPLLFISSVVASLAPKVFFQQMLKTNVNHLFHVCLIPVVEPSGAVAAQTEVNTAAKLNIECEPASELKFVGDFRYFNTIYSTCECFSL